MTKSSKAKAGLLRRRTPFEWAILLVSVAAIAAIGVGLLVYSTQFKQRSPDLVVTIEPSPGRQNEFVLKIENRGETTAEEVVVEVARGEVTQIVEFRAVPKAGEEEAKVHVEGSGEPTAKVVTLKES